VRSTPSSTAYRWGPEGVVLAILVNPCRVSESWAARSGVGLKRFPSLLRNDTCVRYTLATHREGDLRRQSPSVEDCAGLLTDPCGAKDGTDPGTHAGQKTRA
jgi:hypothetical protein